MDLKQLACMVAVAEHQHFGRAAASLGMGQPALSQQIRRLERETHSSLFERSSRHVRLTTAGEAFLPLAREVLQAASRAEGFQPPNDQRIILASSGGLGLALSDAIGLARKRRQGLLIDVVEVDEPQRTALVHRGQVGAALVRRSSRGQDTLIRTSLGSERLWAMVPDGLVVQRRRTLIHRDVLRPLPLRRLVEDADMELAAAIGSQTPEEPVSMATLMAQWAGGEVSWVPLHPLQAAFVARMKLPGTTVAQVTPPLEGSLAMLTREPLAGALERVASRLRDALSQANGS